MAGCARFHPQPLSPAETAASLDERRLDDPKFRGFLETNLSRAFPEWPPKVWDFDMLTLAAFYYHPSLDVARAELDVAAGGDKTAAERPNPVLSAVPGYSFDPASGSMYTPWLPGVSLDVPIETAGKRGYRIAQSRHLSNAARLNITTTAWQVRSNLRASLIDLSGARSRETLLRRQLDLQDQLVKSLEQQFQAGAVASTDLTTARIARDRVRFDWLDAQRLGAESLARVADAIGVPVSAVEAINLSPDLFPPVSADELTTTEIRRAALLGRSDILGALAEYAASQSALQLEIAKQYPDIHLGPGYQYDQGNQLVTLGLTIELPVLSQNQGPIAEAAAKRALAAAQFLELQAKVMNQIDSALAGYRAASGQLATLESLQEAQEQQSKAVESQVKAGEAAQLDTLNARVEEGTAELAALDGRLKLQQALGVLEDAMQRPIPELKPSVIENTQRPRAMKETHP
jgi:cobalt-zinc-cadmium efflux system outer membrane protein